MSKFITVPSQYTIYEVTEEAAELLPMGIKITPPQIVLEVLVMNGNAKRVGTVGTLTMNIESASDMLSDSEGEDEDPPEGSGPWL